MNNNTKGTEPTTQAATGIAKNKNYIATLTGMGILTAMVVVLQLVSKFIPFGPFSITLALTPIIIGGAIYGMWPGAWLGFVMGLTVLLSGDAAPFLTVNVFGTLLTVLVKSSAAGLIAALIYKLLEKKNNYVAVIAASAAAPIVNTGIFIIGTYLFFLDTVTEWAAGMPVFEYVIFGMIGLNFVVELVANLALSTVVTAIIGYVKKINNNRG